MVRSHDLMYAHLLRVSRAERAPSPAGWAGETPALPLKTRELFPARLAGLDLRPLAIMLKLPHTKSCFVCGLNNPLGMKLDLETDGQIVRARFLPRPEHVGFRETIHGGLISTVLDEAMVWAVGV